MTENFVAVAPSTPQNNTDPSRRQRAVPGDQHQRRRDHVAEVRMGAMGELSEPSDTRKTLNFNDP